MGSPTMSMWPEIELVTTISPPPCPFMAGITACAQRSTPSTFSASMRVRASMSPSANCPGMYMPALASKMSTRPKRASVRSTILLISAASGHVGADDQRLRVKFGRERLQLVHRTRGQRQPAALLCQHPRASGANAGTGAGNDGDFVELGRSCHVTFHIIGGRPKGRPANIYAHRTLFATCIQKP